MHTFGRIATLKAHQGAVLCLTLSEDRKMLFSSGGDAIVKVWDAVELKPLYVLYSTFDIGDVFSVVYSQFSRTVYLGAQNTSIQVCEVLMQLICSGMILKPFTPGRGLHRPLFLSEDTINFSMRKSTTRRIRAMLKRMVAHNAPHCSK